MPLCLTTIALATFAYLAFFQMKGAKGQGGVKPGKLLTAGYLAGSTLLLVLMIAIYVGFPSEAMHRAARHVEFQGVAIDLPSFTGDASNFRLSGDEIDADSPVRRAFRWFALRPKSQVDLRPISADNGKIVAVRGIARNAAQVIRLNDVCINLPIGRPVASGDSETFDIVTMSDPTHQTADFTVRVDGGQVKIGDSGTAFELLDRLSLRTALTLAGNNDLIHRLSNYVDDSGSTILDEVVLARFNRKDPRSPVVLLAATQSIVVSSSDRAGTPFFEVKSPDGNFRVEAAGPSGVDRLKLVPSSADGRTQIQCLFDPPRSFPMPPDSLMANGKARLQFASGDAGQQVDGYMFDAGNLNDVSLINRVVTANGQVAGMPWNTPSLLGDVGVSAIYSLVDPLLTPDGSWPPACLALIVGAGLCGLSWVKVRRRGQPPRLGLRSVAPIYASFIVWVGASTVLTVRLILAHRVSVLPPFNMDSISAASYRSCEYKAMLGICTIPPLLGLLIGLAPTLRAMAMPELPKLKLLERIAADPWAGLALAANGAALGIAFLQALHKIVHFPFFEGSLFEIALIVLGLILEGVAEHVDGPTRDRPRPWLRLGRILMWAAFPIILFNDPGSFILCFPIAVAALLRNARARFEVPAFVCLALLVIFAAPGLGRFAFAYFPVKSVVRRSSSPYRLIAADPVHSQDFLVDPLATPDRFDPREMRRALLQRWEMSAYVKGAGAGYYQAPLSNVGMTYPTMLSDAAYSVFVVGENGRLTGLSVTAVLLCLALGLMLSARESATMQGGKTLARPLFAIGGAIGCAAVYMSLANLWSVPFTGQNVPFLALDSYKDLALNGFLLVAAILLISFPGSSNDAPDWEEKKQARAAAPAWFALPVILFLGWFSLGWQLISQSGDPGQPYNLNDTTLQRLAAIANAAVKESRERRVSLHETDAYKGAPAFARSAIERYESGAATETPLIEQHGPERFLGIDHRFYVVASPFLRSEGVPWRGSLVATGETRRHNLRINGRRQPFSMEVGAPPAVMVLGRRFVPQTAQSIDLVEAAPHGRSVDYGGIKLVGDKVVFRWRTAGKPGSVRINGEIPELAQNEWILQPDDIVTLSYPDANGVAEQFTFSYPGPTDDKLANVIWRNGSYIRTFPQGADFPLARSIADVADSTKYPKKDIQLSVDLQLQRSLQGALRKWATTEHRLVDRGIRKPDGLPFTALSVIDSYTGKVKALAAVPSADPSEDFADIRARYPSDRDALTASRSTWNFVNRTIGSTIKPLGFSALCSQLDSKSFKLENLKVDEAAAVEGDPPAYRKLGDIDLPHGKMLSGHENPRGEVDMFTYLRDSRTWPAIVTSTIGLVADKSSQDTQAKELRNLLVPSGDGALWIGDQRVALRPREALTRIFDQGSASTLNSVELDQTAYFQGIQDCYGPDAVSFDFNENSRHDLDFLSPLRLNQRTLADLGQFVLPRLHVTDTTALTDFDSQLLRYMIGAGECRWNALTMAVNGARIMTGVRVEPTLDATADSKFAKMPWPISDFKGWREPHLLSPLQQISTMPAADAAAVRAAAAGSGYRIAMKTGTIDDGSKSEAMESEMLMFTVGSYNNETGFVPGKSVSGFLSIRSSKLMEGQEMIKGDLARAVIPILVDYLNRQKR